jgi:lysophospholipase L1-like esterase
MPLALRFPPVVLTSVLLAACGANSPDVVVIDDDSSNPAAAASRDAGGADTRVAPDAANSDGAGGSTASKDAAGSKGQAGADVVDGAPPGPVLPPFWATSTMLDESALFVRDSSAVNATANLLFVPETIVSVQSCDGKVAFEQGVDFAWDPGTRLLTLTAGSRMPSKTYAEMHPPLGSPQSLPAADGQSGLFFSEGHVFRDLQVQITYRHAETWQGTTSSFAGDRLPRTLGRLNRGEPISLVALGDSITQGYNASGFVGVAPFTSPYAGLVADVLRQRYGSQVTLKNLGQAGQASAWGIGMVAQVVAQNPDLVLIAFGMNDGGDPAVFANNIAQIVAGVRSGAPSAEFILVATMAANPEATGGNAAFFPASRDALAGLATPGVALADVTGVWLDVVQKKKFTDLTGNGINHPNDFGHRLYAQVIASLLVP